ncbi:unnamed protein product [Rotaria sp. Silwood2]|nr:unnamed protein product [Rotaria sp. Silwood2]
MGMRDNQWLLRRISLHGNTDNSKSNQDDISIDDLAVNQGLCPKSIICDFESNDLCRYVNDPTNTIDWKRLQAENDSSLPSTDVTYIDFNWRRTPSHDTGPSGDHITGTGYYVYIEASTPQIPGNPTTSSCLVFFITYVRIVNTWKGDIALDDIQLNHDNAPPSGRSCLHLWYYLYRAEQGTLLIQQKSEIGRAKIIWTKSNDQDNIWHQKRTTVPPLLDSGTAIDDLLILTNSSCTSLTIATTTTTIMTTQSSYCNSTHFHCLQNTHQCIPKDQFCNFNIECIDQTDELSCPRTCNFKQKNLCL